MTNKIKFPRPFSLKAALAVVFFFLAMSIFFLHLGFSAPIGLTIIGGVVLLATIWLFILTFRSSISLKGSMLEKRGAFLTRRVNLKHAKLVKIETDNLGSVQLFVDSGTCKIRVALIIINDYNKMAVSLQLLGLISDGLNGNQNAVASQKLLTEHINYVNEHKSLSGSPLGEMISTSVLDTATTAALDVELFRIVS